MTRSLFPAMLALGLLARGRDRPGAAVASHDLVAAALMAPLFFVLLLVVAVPGGARDARTLSFSSQAECAKAGAAFMAAPADDAVPREPDFRRSAICVAIRLPGRAA